MADYQGQYTGPQIDERLTLAGTAYQKPENGIPAEDLAQGVIPDVSNFITKSVNDLVNYYLKSDTYTKEEVLSLIAALRQFHYEVYASTADVTNPQSNVLYLIGPTGTGSDKYEEYVYPDAQTGWVKIGDTSIDLSGYVTMEALNTALANYQTIANLVTSWGQTLSDTKYPSEKLVYDSFYKRGVISQTQTWTQAQDGGYDYVMSDLVYGDIPKSNIDLYEAAGAIFNETTGYFELNGLTDISYEEMSAVYNMTIPAVNRNDLTGACNGFPIRTTLPLYRTFGKNTAWSMGVQDKPSLYSAFSGSNLEVINLCPVTPVSPNRSYKTALYAFIGCRYLKEIIGAVTTDNDLWAFSGGFSLASVTWYALNHNQSFRDSPRLSVASILYMINNEAATSAITITLHATAYARAIADTDVQTALQNHPLVTLASA